MTKIYQNTRILFLIIITTFIAINLKAQQTSTFTDPRDGKTYKTVKIGNQDWMAENLNFESIDSWCYNNDTINCKQYGRLYSWEAAKTACPAGWHLPSKSEFEVLLKDFGGNESMAYNSLIQGGNSRFSAVLGGFRDFNGSFYTIGDNTGIWSSSPYDEEHAFQLNISNFAPGAVIGYDLRSVGFSIRCLKDY
jgi:uncharacterized protein (TIGR02145 family)